MKTPPPKLYTLQDTDLFLDNPLKEYILKVRDLPIDEKPRQKLVLQGPEVLSPSELLAVLLNVGSKNEDVMEMSSRIVKEYGESSIFAEKDPSKLGEDLKIPIMKACQIVACGELGRRFYARNSAGFTVIRTAQDAYNHLRGMQNLSKEHLRGLYLNSHNRIIHDEVISIGTITTNIVHPREVFRPAIEYNAVAIVLAHNHPSGNTMPSAEDIEITQQLIKAGKLIGINVLDHVIITKDAYVSIKANY